MELKQTALVLADISGYTRFTRNHRGTLLHAEQIISELLEAVIDAAEYPLAVSKLEGDAVFLYAHADSDPAAMARDVLRQVNTLFVSFAAKTQALQNCTTCPCEACQGIDDLKLKVVVHYGEVAVKRIRQWEELAGEPVIVVHRLMKNSVPAKEYLLLSDTFWRLAGGMAGREAEERREAYDDIGAQQVWVYYLGDGAPVPAPLPPASAWRRWWQVVKLESYAWRRRIGLTPAPPMGHLE